MRTASSALWSFAASMPCSPHSGARSRPVRSAAAASLYCPRARCTRDIRSGTQRIACGDARGSAFASDVARSSTSFSASSASAYAPSRTSWKPRLKSSVTCETSIW